MNDVSWYAAVFYVCENVARFFVAALAILRPPRRQASTLAWVLIIMALPLFGIFAFFLFGEVHLGRDRVRRHREIVDRMRAFVSQPRLASAPPELGPQYQPIANLAQLVGETEPIGGNVLELMGDTNQVIDALVADIDRARLHCHLLFYIYLADGSGQKVARALLRATARGVRCRLLVDSAGSEAFLDSPLCGELERGGVAVVRALPRRWGAAMISRVDLRNHRKIVVIDGIVGYSGSQNVADAAFAPKPRFAPWVDVMLRFEGPAVRDLQELFIEDWFLDTDEGLEELLEIAPPAIPDGIVVQVMGTGPNSRNEALVQVLQAAFHTAREEVIVTTPYFVPDEGTRAAMVTAARRGLRCVLVVPNRNDSLVVGPASRSHYQPLLDAGVEIFEYEKGLLHAKTMTVDRDLAVVSTANFDRRSFELNFEVSTLIYDSDFASRLRFLQRSYMEDSRLIDPERWSRRGWPRRLVQNAAGILGPIL